jgi:hypothetical protein
MGVIGMTMGDHGTVDRLPGIHVKIACGAIEAAVSQLEQHAARILQIAPIVFNAMGMKRQYFQMAHAYLLLPAPVRLSASCKQNGSVLHAILPASR